MDYKEKLIAYGRKTITLQELTTLLNLHSDSSAHFLITSLVKDNYLSPMLKSKKNGNIKYPLYMKYWITAKNDYSEALKEISTLHPRILSSGTLQDKPELYLKYKADLLKLNRYLFGAHSSEYVSRKERSYEIFDEEKRLEDSGFRALLVKLGITTEYLHYYSTPEHCFNDFIPERKEELTLLICENKDIWFNIRRCMYEDGASYLFGKHIDGVIFGEGNKVSEKGALDGYSDFLGAHKVHYLYWGDIDRAGLYIYQSVLNNNEHMSMELFIPGYIKMLEFERERVKAGHKTPDSDDNRVYQVDYHRLLSGMPDQYMLEIMPLFEHNKRLPQEVINYEILKQDMR